MQKTSIKSVCLCAYGSVNIVTVKTTGHCEESRVFIKAQTSIKSLTSFKVQDFSLHELQNNSKNLTSNLSVNVIFLHSRTIGRSANIYRHPRYYSNLCNLELFNLLLWAYICVCIVGHTGMRCLEVLLVY